MKDIYLLCDYKGRFGSKYHDNPYRSGLDKGLLKKYFEDNGFNTIFLKFNDVDFRIDKLRDQIVLYTSSEDRGFYYKSYIEDVIYGLEIIGACVVPSYRYLRANNNKVFMEIIRLSSRNDRITNINSRIFGTYEEFMDKIKYFDKHCILKKAEGACGRGVYLANTSRKLYKIAKKISRTRNITYELWDFARFLKHRSYTRDSRYRSKFIIQDFILGLKNDWKIYIFGKRYYIFYRPILEGRDIRASGGGYKNYLYGNKALMPEGIFDFAKSVFDSLDVPYASLDIAFDGKVFYLFEFQCVYFGMAGVFLSNEYFINKSSQWIAVSEKLGQEQVYVDSITEYLKNKGL